MTSYLTLIKENLHLSGTFSSYSEFFCQKSPILIYPTCIWCYHWGWPCSISLRPFDQKTRVTGLLCGIIYVILCLAILRQYQCVIKMDALTHDDSLYCASIAWWHSNQWKAIMPLSELAIVGSYDSW